MKIKVPKKIITERGVYELYATYSPSVSGDWEWAISYVGRTYAQGVLFRLSNSKLNIIEDAVFDMIRKHNYDCE